ncbi:fukutin-like isoform X2 [Stegodyphus dumicola]|uniref:fukutin-like isoform X2 n=1 Tax=Stegodyphus dumicola TaxID=202533 RepID=UPI0015B2AEBC|nr:fukutin-like isoform X2 [Stegodyphus dumicola]
MKSLGRHVKFLFVGLLLVSAILLLMTTTVVRQVWDYNGLSYDFSSSPEILEGVLQQQVDVCLIKPPSRNPQFLMEDADSFESFQDKATKETSRHTLINTLAIFSDVMEVMGIKTGIIEPSILFCMLTWPQKQLLMKRNFNVSDVVGSQNTVTLGIFAKDAELLEQDPIQSSIRSMGFQIVPVKEPLRNWMQEKTNFHRNKTFTGHIFYKRGIHLIHLVVFQERATYLWHAGLSEQVKSILPLQDLLFVDADSSYENFTFVPLLLKKYSMSLYVPSDPQYFLFQIRNSRFLECNMSRAANLTTTPDPNSKSLEAFRRKFIISLRELKSRFRPLLQTFWIWSGTMLGWYRQCDIIPYTTDVDFGAWASEVEDLDALVKLFLNDKHLSIRERMGLVDEALEFQLRCYGLRVDVFFLYKIQNGTWYSGHRSGRGYYFRYYHPNFTLCSGDLLGERVQVPCETEKVIIAEYGPEWSLPVPNWYYESSIKNRGPNIYWDNSRVKLSYKEYS